jgi:hypothetical protein
MNFMENQNPNVVSLDNLSLIELKALHYDTLKEMSRAQNNLQVVSKKIEEFEANQETVPTEVVLTPSE